MDNSDGRKLHRKALEAIRISAVMRVEAGESPEVVFKALGFTRALIYTWIAKYREGGIDALRSRKAPGNVFLIVDNHSVHRSEEVRDFVKSTEGKLRLFYLPPYAPELNPDEHVWNYLKNHKIGRQMTKNGFALAKRVESIIRSLQRLPDKLRSFFNHPWTKYAAVSTDQQSH